MSGAGVVITHHGHIPGLDFLPGFVVFGLGLAVMVAPLTTCLMTAVAVRYSGLGSAINNAISRVGPQLADAVIFVAITASFYTGMARRIPGMDVTSQEARAQISPLNRPGASVSANQVAAARDASTEAFGLAMLISVVLLAGGAAINAIGIKDPPRPT